MNSTKNDTSLDVIEEDELDLVKLVTSNANDANQYLIFEGSNGEFYAINVAKVDEILIYGDFEIAHNTDGSLIIGTAQIREKMTPLILFDAWFGTPILEKKEYELMILASFGGHRIAMIVKRVEDIVVIESNEMENNARNNANTSFLATIKFNGALHLCTIFDSDKMLLDIFQDETLQNNELLNHILPRKLSTKTLFFADDSRLIRQMVQKLFSKLGLTFQIFENGLELIDALAAFPADDIALVITDIEMPVKNGHEVVAALRANKRYDPIKIIVHTNMANNQMRDSLLQQGVNCVIGKVNLATLESAIAEFIR
ncbi:MAG: chemotaxis protein CheW [Sulfurimonas sp.]